MSIFTINKQGTKSNRIGRGVGLFVCSLINGLDQNEYNASASKLKT